MKKHYKLVILGGGAGGISTASRILSKNKNLKNDILIIEPDNYHYFQPAWPLVGSGEVNLESTWKPTGNVVPKGSLWLQESVDKVDPVARVVTAGRYNIEYDFLVVALGLELDYEAIDGLPEALGTNGICTNYLVDHVEYTYRTLKKTESGNIIVTKPKSKIKGGVSAENSLFTMDEFL